MILAGSLFGRVARNGLVLPRDKKDMASILRLAAKEVIAVGDGRWKFKLTFLNLFLSTRNCFFHRRTMRGHRTVFCRDHLALLLKSPSGTATRRHFSLVKLEFHCACCKGDGGLERIEFQACVLESLSFLRSPFSFSITKAGYSRESWLTTAMRTT